MTSIDDGKEKIIDEFALFMLRCESLCDDPSYAAYLAFSISGSMLKRYLAPGKFKELLTSFTVKKTIIEEPK